MASCCAEGHLHSGTPAGKDITLAGNIPCYVSFCVEETHTKKKALVLFTDVFGYKLVNVRLIADEYAKRGFTTYVPDLHAGAPLAPEKWDSVLLPKAGFFNKVIANFKFTGSLPSLISWFGKHGDDLTIPIVDKVLTALRTELKIEKLGVVGYCWGGRYCILAGGINGIKSSSSSSSSSSTTTTTATPALPRVDAIAPCHPSFVKVAVDVEQIQVPVMFSLAENDGVFSKSDVQLTRNILAKKTSIDSKVTEYAGTKHGFSVRGEEHHPIVSKARKDVLDSTAAFFAKHLQ